MSALRRSSSLIVGLALLVGSGCSESSKTDTSASFDEHVHGHDDHDHGPKSLKDATATLESMRDTIRDAFARNDQDTAHDPLHEVGHVLEAIPELAKKEKVSADNQAAIETAVNSLMEAFGRVDKTMHGQEGSTYSEESAAIDATLESLSQACGLASSKTETSADNAPPEVPQETPESIQETAAPSADTSASNEEKGE